MVKVNSSRPMVLVTDAGRSSAIAVIRSLGRKGYRLVAADSNPKSLGFYSRYVKEKLVYPAPENAPREFCDFLLNAVKTRGIDLVIPATDLTIQPLARARAAFQGITRLAIPENAPLEVVTDKMKTVELAKRLGVPVPTTFLVNTAREALEKAEALGWPIVLKPQASKQLRQGKTIESFQVTYAASREELHAAMRTFEGRCAVLLQSYCEGTGLGVELLMHDGEPLAAFQHKRLREIPLTGGASAYRESVALDAALYEFAVRLLSEQRWTGLAMVEFKVNGVGAQLMEINGRVWGSLPLAVASGVDFPGMLADLYLEGADSIKPRLGNSYKVGVRCRDLQRDLMWITSVLMGRQRYAFLKMPSRARALRALLSLFNPARKFDLISPDDPLPGLMELPRIIKKFRHKMREAE